MVQNYIQCYMQTYLLRWLGLYRQYAVVFPWVFSLAARLFLIFRLGCVSRIQPGISFVVKRREALAIQPYVPFTATFRCIGQVIFIILAHG